MLKARSLALLICIAAATAAFALDPRVALTQYGHRAWSTDDGLPQSTLQAIAQTPDGYIWVGTQNGLERFDGVHFAPPDNASRARNVFVFALLVDRRGTLWVGSTGQQSLFTYSDGFFTPVTSLYSLGVSSVFSLVANWLDVLKADHRAIFTAASHAQRAADFINGLQPASAG